MALLARQLTGIRQRLHLAPRQPDAEQPFEDLHLLDSGAEYDDEGNLKYFWRQVRLRASMRDPWVAYWQIVSLRLLDFLPADEQESASRFRSMAVALRGLLHAGVQPVYLKTVIPGEIGVVQIYGVSVLHPVGEDADASRSAAIADAESADSALLASLQAAYPQSQYAPLDLPIVRWLIDAYEQMPFVLVQRGHNDPREATPDVRSSMNPLGASKRGRPEEIGLRQGEIISQGMLAQNFPMFQASIYNPIGASPSQANRELTRLYQRLARQASAVRSLVNGTRGWAVSLGTIISGSINTGEGSATGYSTARGESAGQGHSRSASVAHTDGWSLVKSHGVATSRSEAWGTSWANSVSSGGGHSVGVGHTVGTTQGQAVSQGQSASQSQTDTHGQSVTHSESQGVSDSQGWAATHGGSNSQSVSNVPAVTTRSHSETNIPQIITESASGSGPNPANPPTTITTGGSHPINDPGALEGILSGRGGGGASAPAAAPAPVAAAPATPAVPGGTVPAPQIGASGVSGGMTASPPMAIPAGAAPATPGGGGGGGAPNWIDAAAAGQISGSATLPGGTQNVSGHAGVGVPGVLSVGGGYGESHPLNPTVAVNFGGTESHGQQVQVSGETLGHGQSIMPAHQVTGDSWTTTPAHQTTSSSSSSSWGNTQSGSHTTSHSTGVAHGISESQSIGESHGVSSSRGTSEGQSQATTRMETTTSTWGQSSMQGGSHTVGVGQTVSDSVSRGTSGADSQGSAEGYTATGGQSVMVGRNQTLSLSRGVGLGVGLAPSVSVTETFQFTNYEMDILARALEEQMLHVDAIIKEGGVYVDTYYLVPDLRARQALAVLIQQAYWGTEDVVTPVQTLKPAPDEEASLRLHAYLMLPSTVPDTTPYALEGWRYTSLLRLRQAASLMIPEVFEYGRARTVARRMPRYALHHWKGEIYTGYQWTHDLNRLSEVPLQIPLPWFINGSIVAPSGAGKSVLIQRLAYEFQKVGELVFVFDMGDGLRDLLHVLPAGRYDVTGIAPRHPRRSHWNPLQIGRRIDPDSHIDTTVEIISNAGGLGAKQRETLSQALRALYWEAGALTNDPDLWRHPKWGKLYPDDMQALDKEHQRRGLSPLTGQPTLGELEDWEQQAIAVWRSRRASFLRLYRLIDILQDQKPGGTKSKKHGGGSSIDSVEGLKDRIRPLTRRSVDPAQWLRADEEPVPLDTYRDRFPDGGVVIIEGGGLANPYIKAVWFGLAVALLYGDAMARFNVSEVEDPGARQRFTLILNEANQLTTAGATVDDKNKGSAPATAGLFLELYQELRKYNGRAILGVQDAESIAESMLTNSAVTFFGMIRSVEGLRIALSKNGISPTGMTQNEYWQDFASRQKYFFTTQCTMADTREDLRPCLLHPAMLPVVRITNAELSSYFAGG